MAGGFTRRTHIVRISDSKKGEPASTNYIDVEVLDAIAFRVEGNKEVILNMDQTKADPFIVDNTGGNHGKQPGNPTQRTLMRRIKSKSDPGQQLDIEVLQCAAYRDQRGEEWILDMQNGSRENASSANISDGSGNSNSTRRTHSEIITSPGGLTKKEAGDKFLTVQRSDNISFRRVRGEEVIISIPSCDSEDAENVDFGRASTFVTPEGYDPDKDDSPTPPTLADSGDKHNYLNFVDGADGFLTGDEKIDMGPFWWIRKVSATRILFVTVGYSLDGPSAPALPSITLSHMTYNPGKTWDVLDKVDDTVPGAEHIPPIVNPVTNAMLAVYNQWTPAKAIQKRAEATDFGEKIWWVDGSNADVGVDSHGEGFVSPEVTKDNFGLLTYFVPGSGAPILVTTENPDPENDDFSTKRTVIQSRAPLNSAVLGGGAESAPAISLTNIYTSEAAAIAGANALNAQNAAFFAPLLSPGFDGARVGFVAGPISLSTGSQAFTLEGAAVFAVNIGNLKPTKGKVTFQLDIAFGSEGHVTVGAEVYKKLRDFELDNKNLPNFLPWADASPLPTKAEGGKFGTSGFSTSNSGGTSGKLIGTIDLKTLDVTFTP